MTDLRIDFLGRTLQSPLILASGPLSHNGEAIIRAHQAGFGAVVTKTISSVAAKNPFPHLIQNGRTLFNCEKWSTISCQPWTDKEIPYAKKHGAVIIASIGLTMMDVKNVAKPVANAGADFIELVSYRSQNIVPMVKEALSLVNLPVIAKVSFNWPRCEAIALQCLKAGAAGISAIDSVGPGLRIDIHSGRPLLGSSNGRGWISGEAIKPLALHCVAEIASMAPEGVVIGTGGVSSAEDVVEMLMAGASAVGLCSYPIEKGLEKIEELHANLRKLLTELGYNSLSEVKGICRPHLKRDDFLTDGKIVLDNKICNNCNLCVKLCPYQAIITEDGKLQIESLNCHLCGYCISVCPQKAISLIG